MLKSCTSFVSLLLVVDDVGSSLCSVLSFCLLSRLSMVQGCSFGGRPSLPRIAFVSTFRPVSTSYCFVQRMPLLEVHTVAS